MSELEKALRRVGLVVWVMLGIMFATAVAIGLPTAAIEDNGFGLKEYVLLPGTMCYIDRFPRRVN